MVILWKRPLPSNTYWILSLFPSNGCFPCEPPKWARRQQHGRLDAWIRSNEYPYRQLLSLYLLGSYCRRSTQRLKYNWQKISGWIINRRIANILQVVEAALVRLFMMQTPAVSPCSSVVLPPMQVVFVLKLDYHCGLIKWPHQQRIGCIIIPNSSKKYGNFFLELDQK